MLEPSFPQKNTLHDFSQFQLTKSQLNVSNKGLSFSHQPVINLKEHLAF